tara:strand:+ start:2377 stop:3105 length:729 start_codon:yes stop_codon:yes gene_type:complete
MANSIIKHVSIIMDGNGRWAKERNMPRSYGHRKGIDAVKKIINASLVRQISSLTLFAFSSENWIRPSNEVKLLMTLFRESIINNMENLHENNIKVTFIGDLDKFDRTLKKYIYTLEELTKHNSGLELNFAVNYGGKWDIINAVNKALSTQDDLANKSINKDDIEKNLSFYKNHPDLMIRTAGEHRLSNFMLWQHAYTELYFTDTLWPDFDEEDFDTAIKFFHNKTRKFGGLKSVNQIEQNEK